MILLAFAETVQLLPDGSLLIHIALILLMIYILNRTFFRPVNRVIEARVKNKGGRFTEAEEILNQVKQKRAAYDAALLEARSKGYETIEQERAEALQNRQTMLNQVKDEVAGRVAQDRAEIERQTEEARAVIARQADEMADKISTNILKAAG